VGTEIIMAKSVIIWVVPYSNNSVDIASCLTKKANVCDNLIPVLKKSSVQAVKKSNIYGILV